MMKYQTEEILLIEDNSNLLKDSLKSIKKDGYNNKSSVKNGNNTCGRDSVGDGHKKNAGISNMGFALIYSRPSKSKNGDSGMLKFNSTQKIMPLFLLAGPKENLAVITEPFNGAYRFSKETVNLHEFMKKVKKIPTFWVIM